MLIQVLLSSAPFRVAHIVLLMLITCLNPSDAVLRHAQSLGYQRPTRCHSTDAVCCGACRYFGAAKQLPGVKELFEKEAPRQLRRTRHQMYAHINADYYGFRDEEDGVLERVEAEAERAVRQKVRTVKAGVFF